MCRSLNILSFTILVLLICSCQRTNKKVIEFEVKHSGALKKMMSGSIQSVVSLDSLSNKKHLYALGAFENLQGEIQVFNGMVYNSMVQGDRIHIEKNLKGSASLLVYSEVSQWKENFSFLFASKGDLDSLLINEAKRIGLDINKPFPFILEGKVSELKWHVINWDIQDSTHTHKKHQESGLRGTLNNEVVSVLGFYSKKHKAVFTHHSSNTHMHFRTKDQSLAGHVDALKVDGLITLKLPKQ
tara:strand:+ start:5358 stop:6083 length:726 start_codon:yes stop_codon:yes gene_type:complete